MATLGSLVMGLFLDSRQAEEGLDKTKKKTKETAGELGKAGSKSGSWFQSIRTNMGVVTGLATSVVATLTGASAVLAGGHLEATAIKMATLSGSWEQGVQQLGQLREMSRRTGATLDSLVESYKELIGVGISADSSMALIKSVENAGQILGGGSVGIQKAAKAMASLLDGGMATEEVLRGLNTEGVPVFKHLADGLTQMTGRVYTARDAMFALRRNTIAGFTAIQAIQAASNSPEAKLAAERRANSFEGQKEQLFATVSDLMGNVGKAIIDSLKLPVILAAIRGFADRAGEVIEALTKQFGLFKDPKDMAVAIANAFEDGKNFATWASQVVINSVLLVADIFKRLAIFVAKVADAAAGNNNVGNALLGAGAGAALGMLGRQRVGRGLLGGLLGAGGGLLVGVMLQGQNQAAGNPPPQAGLNAANIIPPFPQRQGGGQPAAAAMNVNQQAFAQAKAHMEAVQTWIANWNHNTGLSVATPFERINLELQETAVLAGQVAKDWHLLTQQQQTDFREIMQRKQAGALQEMLKEFSPGDSFLAGRAERGSAAAVETVIRNQYSESNMDPTARLELVAKRANIIAEETKQIQLRLLEAAQRAKIPNVVRFG